MTAPDYVAGWVALSHDPGRLGHVNEVLCRVAHRLTCHNCMGALTPGSDGEGAAVRQVNETIDAQLDVLVAGLGDGNERLALYLTVRAFAETLDDLEQARKR
jgi:hypothetical protein